MLKTVDYDDNQHRNYVAGRDLGRGNALFWARIFAAHAPASRPLSVLDLGSGTGRFTPVLAETFGEAVGVEPSNEMRRIAIERTDGAHVRYLEGRAEAIPAADHAFDLVLLFLSFHHVTDKAKAAAEIARVLRPEGRVMIRSPFPDRPRPNPWHDYFPRARELESRMFPTLAGVEALFAAAGLRRVAFVECEECVADSLAQHAERLRLRAISTFEHLTETEIEDGFARLDRAVAAETGPRPVILPCDMLVLGGD